MHFPIIAALVFLSRRNSVAYDKERLWAQIYLGSNQFDYLLTLEEVFTSSEPHFTYL